LRNWAWDDRGRIEPRRTRARQNIAVFINSALQVDKSGPQN
jgi:hypothetical protein